MKINILKNQIKKIAIKAAMVVVGIGLLFGGTFYYKTSVDDQLSKMNAEKNSIQTMISQKEKLYEDAKKDYETYKLMDKAKNPTPTGLAAANERISSAIPVFNDLKKNYRFTKLDFTISATSPSNKVQSTIFEVFESSLSIEFIGISDEFVFSFINDLKYMVAGFAELKDVTINKGAELIGKESANTDMVNGRMELFWRSLKEKSATANAGSGVFKPDGTQAVFSPLPGSVPMGTPGMPSTRAPAQ